MVALAENRNERQPHVVDVRHAADCCLTQQTLEASRIVFMRSTELNFDIRIFRLEVGFQLLENFVEDLRLRVLNDNLDRCCDGRRTQRAGHGSHGCPGQAAQK
jgi:hypothetical protein